MMNAAQLRDAASPVNPRALLDQILGPRLNQWDKPLTRDSEVPAQEVARAILAIYDDALARLKGKTGPRAVAALAQISTSRAPIAAAFELAKSLQAEVGFDGVLGRELQKRIVSTRVALAAALAVRELATRSTIDAALLECERCMADCRELDRDIAAINDRLSVRFLQWPNLLELRSAEATTQALEKQSAKNPKAAQVHAALALGLEAPAHVAALWIAYETQPDHELIKWRARAAAER